MKPTRCAIYARYSSDRQSPLSIEDQIRKCREFATSKGWQILEDHIYRDEAVSGAGMDRPAFTSLIRSAFSNPSPFDLIIIDDTSRLSRNLADGLQIVEKLRFAGIRITYVSQAIDTGSEQADVLMTVHGLVDSLYIKELGKKTHRGLEGRVLRGFHAGGRCYGYRNVKTEEGVYQETDEHEAIVVRRIFEMSASGKSLKVIARTLNAEQVPSPRPRRGRKGEWCPSAVREMLYNTRYAGKIVWNRSRYIKVPGTNKRVARPRPPEEWHVLSAEHLRIVSDELWTKVHTRLEHVKKIYGYDRPGGMVSRSATSPYLFSGLLVCSICGGKLTIVSGRGKRGHAARYGCPRHRYRGTCANEMTEPQDRLESRLLEGLQHAVLEPEVLDYALEKFQAELNAQLRKMSGELNVLRQRKDKIEAEIRNLTRALADEYSPAIAAEITKREKELSSIRDQVLLAEEGSFQTRVSVLRQWIFHSLSNLRELLTSDRTLARARAELTRHVQAIVLEPHTEGGKRFYVATGDWDLLGLGKGTTGDTVLGAFEMVAGAGFEPGSLGS